MYYIMWNFKNCFAGSTDSTNEKKMTKSVSFMDVEPYVDDEAKTATLECFNQLYMEDDFDDDKANLTNHDAIMF